MKGSKKRDTSGNGAANLSPTHNVKAIFSQLRNYLAANASGVTRDEALARQLITVLLCKLQDEIDTKHSGTSELRDALQEGPKVLHDRLQAFFRERVITENPTVFKDTDTIELDPISLHYVLSSLIDIDLRQIGRDAIGDAFEMFLGPALRGGEGQFFTPKNVVRTAIEMIDPNPNERILDPACGSGGFLVVALEHILQKGKKAKSILQPQIVGIEKDQLLARLARAYLAILGGEQTGVYCDNSLVKPELWDENIKGIIRLSAFDIVVTNPPFGAKIPVKGIETLKQYQLAKKWIRRSDEWIDTGKLQDKQSPQILFIERCLQFLKPGGRMAIVLPEGLFGNPTDGYIWTFIESIANVLAVVSLPHETFLPSTHTKTSLLFLRKRKIGDKKQISIFMAVPKYVGHDKNGKAIYRTDNSGRVIHDNSGKALLADDLPSVWENYKKEENGKHHHLGFLIHTSDIRKWILVPDYYNPELQDEVAKIQESNKFDMVPIAELTKKKYISISRGNEIGSIHYGSGDIPFIRTTDIVNWEIKVDPVKCVSEEVYDMYKDRQNLKSGDILFVNDGTFLIGRVAMVSDNKALFQSHLRKISVRKNEYIDPYILLWSLSTPIVQDQIASKTFIQATISTIGNRLSEILIPIPRNKNDKKQLSDKVKNIMMKKEELRREIVSLISRN